VQPGAAAPVAVVCARHPPPGTEQDEVPSAGELVWARHRSGRYRRARVTAVSRRDLYTIRFDDGSVSRDTYPQHIANFNCRADGPPPPGARVQVLWTDDQLWLGVFQGHKTAVHCQVKFEDGSSLRLPRGRVFTLDEPMPKRILRFLVDTPELKKPAAPAPRGKLAVRPAPPASQLKRAVKAATQAPQRKRPAKIGRRRRET